MKVHLRDESYVWVPKTKDFVENSSEELGRSWVSSLRDFRKLLLRSKRYGFFLLWFIFHSRGCLVEF